MYNAYDVTVATHGIFAVQAFPLRLFGVRCILDACWLLAEA